jgi:hypothetical protein
MIINRTDLDYIPLSDQLVGIATYLKLDPDEWLSCLQVRYKERTVNYHLDHICKGIGIYIAVDNPKLIMHRGDGLSILG